MVDFGGPSFSKGRCNLNEEEVGDLVVTSAAAIAAEKEGEGEEATAASSASMESGQLV